MRAPIEKIDVSSLELKDQVVAINRVTKVVKGGKNLSFTALVVVGDGHGHAGFGLGKAREVASAIKKGIEAAKKNIVRVPITAKGATITHTVLGRFGSGRVLLKPASDGTGVIAGATVRAVMSAAGIQNILTKSLGSTTAHNVVKATMDALARLKDPARVARLRGMAVEEVLGFEPGAVEAKRAGAFEVKGVADAEAKGAADAEAKGAADAEAEGVADAEAQGAADAEAQGAADTEA